jgi:DNA recombination protein RmuC
MVKPIGESLSKLNDQIGQIENARNLAYGQISEQVKSMLTTQTELRAETANLVKALRAPQVRGRWGEVQLRRVVELAGMLNRCDFVEQDTAGSGESRLRPDMRIQLPGGRSVIVDAKTPLAAYLEALEAPTDEIRAARLKDHARQVRDHMAKLDAKAYWDQFQPAPQFVVMFIPGEIFFSAALEQDPTLIEAGGGRVVLATPTTLIALLKAVSYGWMQQETADNADEIRKAGSELYDRLSVLIEHFGSVGASLGKAVDSYNKAVMSFESRMLPSARRFRELGIPGDSDIEIEPVEKVPRAVPELAADDRRALPSGKD